MSTYSDLCGNVVFYNNNLKLAEKTYQELVGGTQIDGSGVDVSNQSVLLFQKTNDMTPSFSTSGVLLNHLNDATLKLVFTPVNVNVTTKIGVRINTTVLNDNNDIEPNNVRSSYLIRNNISSGNTVNLSMNTLANFQSNYQDIVNETRESNSTKSNSLLEYVEGGDFLNNEILNIELIVENGNVVLETVELNLPSSTSKQNRNINYKKNTTDLAELANLELTVNDENRVIACEALYNGVFNVQGQGNLANLSNGNILSVLNDLTINELEANLDKFSETVKFRDGILFYFNIMSLQLDTKLWGWFDPVNVTAVKPIEESRLNYSIDSLSDIYNSKELTNSSIGENNVEEYMTRQFVVNQHVYSVEDLRTTMGATALEMRGGKAWYETDAGEPVYKMSGVDEDKVMKKNHYPIYTLNEDNAFDVYNVYALGEILAGDDYTSSELIDTNEKYALYNGDEIKHNVANYGLSNDEIRNAYNNVFGVKSLSLQTGVSDATEYALFEPNKTLSVTVNGEEVETNYRSAVYADSGNDGINNKIYYNVNGITYERSAIDTPTSGDKVNFYMFASNEWGLRVSPLSSEGLTLSDLKDIEITGSVTNSFAFVTVYTETKSDVSNSSSWYNSKFTFSDSDALTTDSEPIHIVDLTKYNELVNSSTVKSDNVTGNDRILAIAVSTNSSETNAFIFNLRSVRLNLTNGNSKEVILREHSPEVVDTLRNTLNSQAYVASELATLGYGDENVVDNTFDGAQYSLRQLKEAYYTIKQVLQSNTLESSNGREISTFGDKDGASVVYSRNDWSIFANDAETPYVIDNLDYDSTNGLVENLQGTYFTLQQLFDSGFTRSTDINSLGMTTDGEGNRLFSASDLLNAGYEAKHLALVDGEGEQNVNNKLTTKNSTLHRNFDPLNDVLYEANEVLSNNVSSSKLMNWYDIIDDAELVYSLEDLNGYYNSDNATYGNYSVDNILIGLLEHEGFYITESKLLNGNYTLEQIKNAVGNLVNNGITLIQLLDNDKYNFGDATIVNEIAVPDYTTFVPEVYSEVFNPLLITIINGYQLENNQAVIDALVGMGFEETDVVNALNTDTIQELYETYKEANNLDTLFVFRGNDLLSNYSTNILYQDGLSSKYLNFTTLTSEDISGTTIIIEDFEQNIALTRGITLDVIDTPQISSDAKVDIDCDIVHFLSTFKFNTDSIDMNNEPITDVKYFTISDNWVHDEENNKYVFQNPMLNVVTDGTFVDGEVMNKNMLRHIANKKFNTYHAVDLFKNETELLEELTTVGITNILRGIKTDVDNSAHTNENGSTDADLNCAIAKTLMKQIMNVDPTRFSKQIEQFKNDNTINSNSQISIPLVHGDKIAFKVSLTAKDTYLDSNNTEQPITRSYKIVLNLVDSQKN